MVLLALLQINDLSQKFSIIKYYIHVIVINRDFIFRLLYIYIMMK